MVTSYALLQVLRPACRTCLHASRQAGRQAGRQDEAAVAHLLSFLSGPWQQPGCSTGAPPAAAGQPAPRCPFCPPFAVCCASTTAQLRETPRPWRAFRPCSESRWQASEPSAAQVRTTQSLLTLPACAGRSLRESPAPLLCCGEAQRLPPQCCCLAKRYQTLLVVYLLSVAHCWAFCSGFPLASRQDPLLSLGPLSAEENVMLHVMLETSTAVAARVKCTLQDALKPLGPMIRMM